MLPYAGDALLRKEGDDLDTASDGPDGQRGSRAQQNLGLPERSPPRDEMGDAAAAISSGCPLRCLFGPCWGLAELLGRCHGRALRPPTAAWFWGISHLLTIGFRLTTHLQHPVIISIIHT